MMCHGWINANADDYEALVKLGMNKDAKYRVEVRAFENVIVSPEKLESLRKWPEFWAPCFTIIDDSGYQLPKYLQKYRNEYAVSTD